MREWFTKDFHWKAFSTLMAVGIWLTVHRISEEPNSQAAAVPGIRYSYDLPVTAVSANADVHSAQLVPKTVNVTVSGPSEIMDKLQSGQIHALVNLSELNSAENLPRTVEISPPRGVSVLNIDPPEVTVTLSKQQ
jgi:YbbR domain-containing protein